MHSSSRSPASLRLELSEVSAGRSPTADESMERTERLELLPAFESTAGVSSVKYTLQVSPGVWLPTNIMLLKQQVFCFTRFHVISLK